MYSVFLGSPINALTALKGPVGCGKVAATSEASVKLRFYREKGLEQG